MLFAAYVLHAVIPLGLLVELRLQGFHGQGLHALLAGAYVHAVSATEAVQNVHSLHKACSGHGFADCGQGVALGEGCCGHLVGVKNEGTDSGVGADIRALVTLYAVFVQPLGHESGNTAFLVAGCALLPGAVGVVLEGRYRQEVAVLGVDGTYHVLDELGCVVLFHNIFGELSPCGIHIQLVVLAAAVYGCVVLVHNILALLAVGFHDKLLHLLHSEVHGDNLGDAEECALQDSVGAVAEADFLSDTAGVHIINGDIVLCEVTFYVIGQVLGKLLALPDGIEQECAVVAQTTQNIVHVQICLYVAGHEVRCGHQICGADGLVAETQVRAGETARLLGVVREVCLAVFVGIVTDNLNRVLVCTHGTVGAEAVELGLESAGIAESDFLGERQRVEGDIVHDADNEVVLGLGKREVLVYAENLCRGGVFGRQTVAAANDKRGILLAVESVLDIQIQGLAVCAGLLGAVKHCDALHGRGDCIHKVLDRERAVQVYAHQTHFLTLGEQVVNSLLGSLCYRTHSDDDAVCILGAVVVEQLVLAAGDFAYLLHVILHDAGDGVVIFVGGLAVLEEHIGVLGCTASYGVVGVEGAGAEVGQCLFVYQCGKCVTVNLLDLLNLVRGAETVKEIYKRNAALDCGQVCHSGEVHNLLHRAFGKHGETGLAARHYILVVAEDRQCVRGQRTRRHMEYARQKLAGYLVHIGNHEQQALRCGVGCGKSTGLQ